MFCKPQDGGDICVPECSAQSPCTDLGFPEHYGCSDGHCVPQECLNPAPALEQYCGLFK